MINVVEDFVPRNYQDFIERTMLTPGFPYHFVPVTSDYAVRTPNSREAPMLVHPFYFDTGPSGYWPIMAPLFFEFCKKTGKNHTMVRCKANLTFQNSNFGKDEYWPPHVDFQEGNITTAIYYVIDSDGDTLFFDNELRIIERVRPKKGMLVYFPRALIHTGMPPRTSSHRCVVNFNFAHE